MSKFEITKTELVWPGKYNEDGTLKEVPRVNLPFQVIETVNESRPHLTFKGTVDTGIHPLDLCERTGKHLTVGFVKFELIHNLYS